MFTFLFMVLIALTVWFVVIYNRLRAESEVVRGSRSNILAAIRKRVDLAQRIADVAKSYADHEKLVQLSTSENLVSMQSGLSADAQAQTLVGQVNALAVAYPELRANTTYDKLMDQWYDLESDIQDRREAYNGAATAYNAYQGALPQILFAPAIGFDTAPYYSTDEDGFDVLPEFQTGDASHLADTLGRLRDRATATAATAATAAKARMDARTVTDEAATDKTATDDADNDTRDS